MSKVNEWQHLKIPFKDIEVATENFKTLIGQGGYGWVYKGKLLVSGQETMVAVKRLNEQFGQGLKEFLTEIQLLSGQHHPNLISLLGYCDEGKEKTIVYEYAERGSLDQYIRRSGKTTSTTLTWLQRLKICVDAARGLDHLHSHVGGHRMIIHRDIKSSNILINENWVGLISDLGLSKLSVSGFGISDIVSNGCGTQGYCEPEYYSTGVVTKKSDVFSFGVVLFEVLCGRLCLIDRDDGFSLSSISAKEYYENNSLDMIIDHNLKEHIGSYSMTKFAAIAYRCLHNDREQRPAMDVVAKELEEALRSLLEKSKKPQESAAGETTRQEWEIDPSKLLIKYVVASGTFGTVYRGVYDGIEVAVKLLDWGEEGLRAEAEIQALRAAFAQEVVVWHKLDHPNVTKFIGATVGSSELQIQTQTGKIMMPSNICCVVVEYLAGGNLKSYLVKNRRKKLAFKVVVQIALDLARGLSYLHSQNIVHRDVKTENLLLDKTRTVKIADFGVARVEASNPNDMTGETGTLGYMAPEVLNGNPYNRKCDVYSFGICLWEIYCCDMPCPNLSFSEITSAVVRQNLRPEIPRCCPSSLSNVMKQCWDGSPDKRPEMDEVVTMLEAINTTKGGGMIPDGQAQGCLCLRKKRGP